MKNLRTAWCLLLAIMCGAGAVRGEIVTLEFAGSVFDVYDQRSVLPEWLDVGTPASAVLQFDTATPDWYPEDPGRGMYLGPGSLMFDIGGLKFAQTTLVQVDILHDWNGSDSFMAASHRDMSDWPTAYEPGDAVTVSISYFQITPPFTMFDSDALTGPFRLSDATHTIIQVSQSIGTGPILYSVRMNMVPVPEPTTWALLGLGLAGVFWRARRR